MIAAAAALMAACVTAACVTAAPVLAKNSTYKPRLLKTVVKYNVNGMVSQIRACNSEKTEGLLTLYSYHSKKYFTLKHFERTSDYTQFVFGYTKLKIDKYRYATMINAQLQDGSNYYEYFWY